MMLPHVSMCIMNLGFKVSIFVHEYSECKGDMLLPDHGGLELLFLPDAI